MGASGAAAGSTPGNKTAAAQKTMQLQVDGHQHAAGTTKAPAALPPGPGCPRLRPLRNFMRQSWAVAGLWHCRQHFAVPKLSSAFVCGAESTGWAAAYTKNLPTCMCLQHWCSSRQMGCMRGTLTSHSCRMFSLAGHSTAIPAGHDVAGRWLMLPGLSQAGQHCRLCWCTGPSSSLCICILHFYILYKIGMIASLHGWCTYHKELHASC